MDHAVAEERLLNGRVDAAMQQIVDALGHNPWSRNLDDYAWAYAFCVPASVQDDSVLCDQLERYIMSVFAEHFLLLTVCEWRDSSADEDWPQNSRYEVDWLGSRHRSVHIGPHLYVEIGPMRPRHHRFAAEVPAELPLWHTRTSEPDESTVNVHVTEVADATALAAEVRKEEMRRLVFMRATSEAWSRWRGQRIFVAANCKNERPWNDQYDWHVVGATAEEFPA